MQLTVESTNGNNTPIRKTPVRGPIDAEERLMANCNTDPSLSTTNTSAETQLKIILVKLQLHFCEVTFYQAINFCSVKFLHPGLILWLRCEPI